MTNPIVSVCCTTYNQVMFIRNAIDGFLDQQTSFDVEICIGEDESNDGTREICLEYKKKYPNRINLALRKRTDVIYINQNATGRYNFIETLKMCRGKYIALCEGDDYWHDNTKLETQVHFLENNPEYGMVYTDVDEYFESNNMRISSKYKTRNVSCTSGDIFQEILTENYSIETCTVLFRASLLKKKLSREYMMFQYAAADVPLWLEIAAQTKIKYLDASTAVRRHTRSSPHHKINLRDRYNFRKSLFQCRKDYGVMYGWNSWSKIACYKYYGREFYGLGKALRNIPITFEGLLLLSQVYLFKVLAYLRGELSHAEWIKSQQSSDMS